MYYHRRNGSKNFLTKKASQPSGNLVVKKKTMISGEKHEKYLKCKNDVKKLLRAFNQELWAISGFLKSGQKSTPYLTRSLRGPANDLHARSRSDRVAWMGGWMDGWMDGWVGGDILPSSIFLILKYVNKQHLLVLKMCIKVAYAF